MGNIHFKHDRYNWGDTFYLYDAQGNRKYHVRSSVLLWNRKFVIYDLNKNVLAEIKNDPKSIFKKKFHILIGGQQVAAITKEISLLPKFTLEGLDWKFEGFMRHSFKLTSDGQTMLEMAEDSTSWGHHPILTFSDSVDELLALSIALTFGYVVYAEDGNSTNHL